MSGNAMHSVFRLLQVQDLPLNSSARLLLFALAGFSNPQTLQCNPYVSTICDLCGLGDRTVRRLLRDLECHGLISRRKRWRNQHQIATEYEFPLMFSDCHDDSLGDRNGCHICKAKDCHSDSHYDCHQIPLRLPPDTSQTATVAGYEPVKEPVKELEAESGGKKPAQDGQSASPFERADCPSESASKEQGGTGDVFEEPPSTAQAENSDSAEKAERADASRHPSNRQGELTNDHIREREYWSRQITDRHHAGKRVFGARPALIRELIAEGKVSLAQCVATGALAEHDLCEAEKHEIERLRADRHEAPALLLGSTP